MSAVAVPDLRLSRLSDTEKTTADGLLKKLQGHKKKNEQLEAYYDAKQHVRDLGIAIPPHLTNLEAAIGWPGTAVDALDERLEHDGWSVGDDQALELDVAEVVESNDLDVEFAQGRLDALIYGVSFVVVGVGGEGEPGELVTVESPMRMTATYNRRRRAVTDALLVATGPDGQVAGGTLWSGPNMVELAYRDGRWTVTDRPTNPLGRPPVHRLVNRPRSSDLDGRSEITRAIRTYTDNAVRTIVAMEVSRDFHAAPKLWLLGADRASFVGPNGEPKTAWETYIGRLNALERDDEGNVPDVKSFPGASPQPFLEQLKGLAQLVAAEAALPVAYMGLVHDANPASADAALVAEARLNKRTERRQTAFGKPEGLAVRDALTMRYGTDPGVTPMPVWRPAATPTLAAAADATLKLVQAGVLPANSDVTLRRIGLSERDRAQVAADSRRARAAATVSALAAAAATARDDDTVASLAP